MRRDCLTVLLLLSVCGFPLCAQPSDDDAIANKFYPASLDAQFQGTHRPDAPVIREKTLLRVDLDGTGNTNYLAVAYFNGLASMLRVIRGTNADDATLVADSTDPTMGGDGVPALYAVDIDNDLIPELVVAFAHSTWIYKYRSGALTLFGPTASTKRGPTTNLGSATFADIDGDGILEILEYGRNLPEGYIIHKFDGHGGFGALPTPAVFTGRFERGEGAPQVITRKFRATPGKYVAQLVNGDQAKAHAVTAGEIRLNQVTIVAPSDLKQQSRFLSVPVELLEKNTLSVELRSDPGTVLSITIIRAP